MEVEVKNQRWDEDLLFAVRKEVLEQWHTGKELAEPRALEEAVEYQKQQPWWKFASLRNARAKEEDSVQVMGQVGHATVEQTVEHIKHCDAVEPERQLMLTDTYSRKNQYKLSQEAIERSYREGFSLLNGYPVVPNGVKGARRVNECTRFNKWRIRRPEPEPRILLQSPPIGIRICVIFLNNRTINLYLLNSNRQIIIT